MQLASNGSTAHINLARATGVTNDLTPATRTELLIAHCSPVQQRAHCRASARDMSLKDSVSAVGLIRFSQILYIFFEIDTGEFFTLGGTPLDYE